MSGIIHPYLYEIDASLLENRTIVRYSMPSGIYNAIKEAQGMSADHAMAFSGLQAVLGWAAPSVDLIGIAASSPGAQKTLTMTAIDPAQSADEMRREIEVAISIWLGIVLPEKAAEITAMLNDGRSARGTPCSVQPIRSALSWNGACASPADFALFDLISLIAARALEGRVLNRDTPDEGKLVLSGAQQSLYFGKALLRHEPSRVDRKRSTGWWTEVFNVAAVSTPESRNLRVAINVGIRNFGEIHEARLGRNRARYMDVFLPADSALAPRSGRIRCIELATTRRDWWNAGRGQTEKESADRRVLKTILGMSGLEFDEATLGLTPLLGGSVGLYPRFGTVHGDQWAPGGTGVPHPEREEYLAFLDKHLSTAGFTRVRMERIAKRGPKEKLVTVLDNKPSDLKTALSRRFGSNDATLALLQSRPTGAEVFDDAIRAVLGEPHSIIDDVWTFGDGLSLKVQHRPAGPFAQILDPIDESKVTGVPKHLQYKIRDSLRGERDKVAREGMAAYLDRTFQSLPPGWMGLVEMNEALAEDAERDPYLLTYQTIARGKGVAQVRLYDPEGDQNLDSASFEHPTSDTDSFAYQNAILDLFRSAGVSPVKNQDLRLAAWWVINLNGKSGEQQAGAKGGFCTPIYIECDQGAISVCLMGHNDDPIRCSYPEAVRLIATGEVANLKFKKADEQSTRIAQFLAQATPRDGKRTVLFVEATNIRTAVPGFRNSGHFAFDRLQLGNVGGAAPVREIFPSDGLSIVRITDEPVKAPCYWVEQSVQGTTAGIFKEPNATRTYWVSRGLPTPLQLSAGMANKQSRHEQGARQYKHRRFPSLSEVTVVVKSEHDDMLELVTLTRAMMQCHIATDEKTILPFPLHEGLLLSGAAR
ncbi:RNaseH domain-containing protein [Azospira oryzae]|nr:RNaseH domain-containing protein [Azospira oryzae]